MSFALFQSYPIAYTSYGAGKNTVVLLHGFCEHQFMWADLIQDFQGEARILTIDLPGFGRSAFIPEAQIETYADAVKAVLDHEQISTCILAGHSMGGYVALAFAKRYPEMLSGLGLLHSHPFEDDEPKKVSRERALEFVKENGSKRYIKELFQGLFSDAFKNNHSDRYNEFISRCSEGCDTTVIQAIQAMRCRPDHTETLKHVKGPVLFIIGKSDTTIAYTRSLEMALLPERAQVEIRNCGHMGIIEDPLMLSDVLKTFLIKNI